MTFEYFNTKFHRDRWMQKQPFTFWYCVDNFYPWKDIVGNKVSKLGSIAELRAFYRMYISSIFSDFRSSNDSLAILEHAVSEWKMQLKNYSICFKTVTDLIIK
jgi:hypothetical protein